MGGRHPQFLPAASVAKYLVSALPHSITSRFIPGPARPPLIRGLLTAWLLLAVLQPLTALRADETPTLSQLRSVLQQHCLDCHGPETAEAGLRVDQLSDDFNDRDNSLAWIEIRNAINLGEMPPQDRPRLPSEFVQVLSSTISSQMRALDHARISTGGRVLLRRMNRHEYTNTISDLLAMKFPTGESPLEVLPPDGTAAGFDRVSTALLLDPTLLTQYYQVARQIAARAIVDGPPEFPTAVMRLEYEDIADSGAISYLLRRLGMNPVPGGIELIEGSTRSFGMLRYPDRRDNNVAPVSGFYRFTLRAGAAPGADGTWPRVTLQHNHPDESMQQIAEWIITAPRDEPQEYTVIVARDTLGGELNVAMQGSVTLYTSQRPGEDFMRRNDQLGEQGDFAATLRLDGRKIAEGWGGDRSTPDPEKLDTTQFPRAYLDYLEVEGPLYDQWPPRSHTMLLGDEQQQPQDLTRAEQILREFLPRAYRRPVTAAELSSTLAVIDRELQNGADFHAALRTGLTAVLTSPLFLYLTEPAPRDTTAPRLLNDYELASRLSYFLWSSMPDEELFRAAAAGELQHAENRRRQVDRMLAAPGADRFITSFAGQWLRTDSFLNFAPDRNLYKEFDDKLADAVLREPLEFFRTVLQQDLPVTSFLSSDFVVINDRLARHYGISDVNGDEFRRVALPADSERGGLLGMAGIHLAGSDGIRTKPVSRAAYLREVLFANPPDPPPPNAGEVEPNIRGENLTVRERLLQHQQIEACAGCHRNLDPWGLALENFNVTGQWRELQDGENFRGDRRPAIDASGTLPNGRSFASYAEFRQLILEQHLRFRRALTGKLLTYALGRPVEPTDDDLINSIADRMATEQDTLRTLIKLLVSSEQFASK